MHLLRGVALAALVVIGVSCDPSRHPRTGVSGERARALLDSVAMANSPDASEDRSTVPGGLPPNGRFAWARRDPKDTTRWVDSRELSGPVHSMQEDVEIVLRGAGWQRVPLDSAEWRFHIAITQRTWFDRQTRVVPGSDGQRANCDLTRSANCPPPPPPRYETISVPRSSEDATLLISRGRQGLIGMRTFAYPNPRETGARMARMLIEWLKAGSGKANR